MARSWGALVLPVAAVLAACSGSNDTAGPQGETFVANMSSAQEVSLAKPSSGTGTATFTVNGGQITMTSLTVQNMDSVTASHIHLGATGANGGIVVPLQLGITTPSGHITSQVLATNIPITQSAIVGVSGAPAITVDSLLTRFRNGSLYVNVHTRANPAGEIRGQIVKQ